MLRKGTFSPERIMKGFVLMTDNSCSKFRYGIEDNLFRHQILNESTSFLRKDILLKMIIVVHRFGI